MLRILYHTCLQKSISFYFNFYPCITGAYARHTKNMFENLHCGMREGIQHTIMIPLAHCPLFGRYFPAFGESHLLCAIPRGKSPLSCATDLPDSNFQACPDTIITKQAPGPRRMYSERRPYSVTDHPNTQKQESDSNDSTKLSDSCFSKSICSSMDCTGLIPAPPSSEEELEAYDEMYQFCLDGLPEAYDDTADHRIPPTGSMP